MLFSAGVPLLLSYILYSLIFSFYRCFGRTRICTGFYQQSSRLLLYLYVSPPPDSKVQKDGDHSNLVSPQNLAWFRCMIDILVSVESMNNVKNIKITEL